MGAPLMPSEPQRLEALRALDVLDTAPDPRLQSIVEIACNALDMPIALVSLVDADRQWFKAKAGLEAEQTCRDYAFCAYAILQNDLFTVEDAREDEHFASNPLVTGAPHIRFYCGMPLRTRGGHNLGTLCVIDTRPRKLTARQQSTLRMLASLVVDILESDARLSVAESRSPGQESADKTVALLLSSLGHELRTPLNHMIGFTELVSANLEGAGEMQLSRNREYLEIIRQSGAHLSEVIDSVMQLEEADRPAELKIKPIRLNDLLAQVVKSFAGTVAAKNQTLVFAPGERDVVALADATSLRQIAINLIANAAKYCPAGASIKVAITADTQSGRCCICVSDNGPGLPDNIVASLGRPFLRGSETGEDGYGLGLHISKRLSERMNGSLSVEPNRPAGTCLQLYLPILAEPRWLRAASG